MDTEIILRVPPEEEELSRRRAELAHLQSELAEQELFLTNLRAELSAFERRYLRIVGVLYAELDEWNKRIAELTHKDRSDDIQEREWLKKITELLTKPDEESGYRFVSGQFQTGIEGFGTVVNDEPEDEQFAPSPSLKSLYREVAKRVHPDLATDEADKEERQHLMMEANAAYQGGDLDALRRILEEYRGGAESAAEGALALALVRINRQIKQVQNRLSCIETEIDNLNESNIAKLKNKAEAVLEGHDLLREMAENVKKRINAARYRYETSLGAKRQR